MATVVVRTPPPPPAETTQDGIAALYAIRDSVINLRTPTSGAIERITKIERSRATSILRELDNRRLIERHDQGAAGWKLELTPAGWDFVGGKPFWMQQ